MSSSSLLSQYKNIEKVLLYSLSSKSLPIDIYINIVTVLIEINKIIRGLYIANKYCGQK
jgi:hypothetical protein